ncbi:DNA-3-methyladenine glycosylase I [Asticcacaulis benevestitus]|uniref:DNA-3-methyladenine glycosylase I n=1 Tax=Asticcacaulis benevestitus DSM 16100 = ATCC BAA-896 TaxID=1121022 RepID=V4PXY0_9CAUL|nr:DNA-3-methyladenine glycosylase I [Asticcacaulis benevestitus]ESQ92274.1 DNA-3-methyladenine glycosylase [Asticcacaulis benevestitus DSM 16100 = ATCC BAA-896]
MCDKPRCPWPKTDPLYCAYHDEEWGVPEFDSRALWEKFVLDGFQAGLSWITILRKRDAFRAAFAGFDPEKVARFDDRDIERLMNNAGIVRSRAKIIAAIDSARITLDMRDKGTSFTDFIWAIQDGKPQVNHYAWGQIPTETKTSQELAKLLKSKGYKFCGPVIVYAFMQAVGMVNDHTVTCFRHAEVAGLMKNS